MLELLVTALLSHLIPTFVQQTADHFPGCHTSPIPSVRSRFLPRAASGRAFSQAVQPWSRELALPPVPLPGAVGAGFLALGSCHLKGSLQRCGQDTLVGSTARRGQALQRLLAPYSALQHDVARWPEGKSRASTSLRADSQCCPVEPRQLRVIPVNNTERLPCTWFAGFDPKGSVVPRRPW
jgi:hypothetical protein